MEKLSSDDLKGLIAKNLVVARQLAGMAQLEAMRELYPNHAGGCKNSNRISEIENGHRDLSAVSLARLCKLYGVSADFILGFTVEAELNETSQIAGRIYNGMYEIAQGAIEQFSHSMSVQCAKFMGTMAPDPKTAQVVEAAKKVLRVARNNPSDFRALSASVLHELESAVRDFDHKQAVQMRNFELAITDIINRDELYQVRHVMQKDCMRKKSARRIDDVQIKLLDAE